jgi:hypothetical protein
MTCLLLGPPEDLCCREVQTALGARGRPARLVTNILAGQTRFAWRFDSRTSHSRLAWDDAPPLASDEITAVLVRWDAWIDPEGWSLDDWTYAQTEAQSALLGWLWSLDCPVVNRYPPDPWFRMRAPLVHWQPVLARCGLPTPEILTTNIPAEARAFGDGRGSVYTPMLGETSYLLAGPEDWSGLEAMQRKTPVSLSRPHGMVRLACVVGPRVVWDGPTPEGAAELEHGLLRFSADTGLDFLEVAFAPDLDPGGRPVVVAVETRPQVGRYGAETRRAVVESLVELLDGSAPRPGAGSPAENREARTSTTRTRPEGER